MLALGWRYRGWCVAVILQQALLIALALGALGATGLGIDLIRHAVDATAHEPHWPLGLSPPASWPVMRTLWLIAALIVAVALACAVLRYTSALAIAELTQRIVVDLRSRVYDKLGRISFGFYDAHESGSIINRVTGDVQAVRMFVDGVIIQIVAVLLSLAVYLGYMLRIHTPLTIACLASTPLLWVASVWFSRRVRPAYLRNSELLDRVVRTLSENIQGVQVVKGFAREAEETRKFAAANACAKEQKREIFWLTSMFQPGMGLLTQLNVAVLLGYGGTLVIRGELRLGEGLFVFAGLLQQFANQVGQITNIANSIQTSFTGAERVFEVLDAPVAIRSRPGAIPATRLRGEIRFERVTFAYGMDPVLRGVDFRVAPGQCVAIVGMTGAGKTTLLSLVPRFYDVSDGRVLIDGVDVRDMDLDDLRRSVGLTFQESFLFSNTVAANIAFGHPGATRGEIEQAARIAAAHGFISELPDGYDTVIGEHGSSLSGGQRQRLAIARAIVTRPPILVLDDPMAAIDSHTEAEILGAMENAMRGRTTLIATHRLSALRRADFIVVLDQGHVVQIGTHDQLMSCRGEYRTAVRLQNADADWTGRTPAEMAA